jgi:nucleoside-diphosphate-sugar epimerase
MRVMEGHDAVIHLAAIPSPRNAAPEVVFGTNVQGTWNVLQAAYESGIGKVVLCSSECATGLCYQKGERPPLYLPVDEAHPLRPTEPYSLSKQLGEAAGESFSRRGGIEVVALRPTLILFPEQRHEIAARGDIEHSDLWSYVEPEDVARAFRLALEREGPAFDVFFVSAADTLSPRPTLELIEARFGHVPELKRPELFQENPNAAIYDIAHARQALGYEPESDWRRLQGEGG